MASKSFSKLIISLAVLLSLGSMSGCGKPQPITENSSTATQAVCLPSQTQTSKIEFPEIQGTMNTKGEMWALLFFDKAYAKEDLKIVWRITGDGDQFNVQARDEEGTVVNPTWGPTDHGGSTWDRPGYEWGTGFNLPKPGCWIFTATRGTTKGEIRLEILAP